MRRARRLAAVRAQEHDVRHINGRFAFEDARLHAAPRVRLGVALDDVDAFDDHLALARQHFDDAPRLAAVFAGDDDHAVVLSHVDFYVHNTSVVSGQ